MVHKIICVSNIIFHGTLIKKGQVMAWFVIGEDGEDLEVVEAEKREDIDDGYERINGPFTSYKEAEKRVEQRELAAENDTGEFDGEG